MDARQLASSTFDRHVARNRYPGRGLAIGRRSDVEGWLLVYFLTGRSENSRNRRFRAEGDRVWTEPVDPAKVADPRLILYDAMLALPWIQVVSNGDQTRTVVEALEHGGRFAKALGTREREPDAPNFTPRIAGMLDCRREGDAVELAILKASRIDPRQTDRAFYRPANPEPGLGYGLTTYAGDGSPLPSFSGDPLLLPLEGSPEDVLETWWAALDAENRIALAVKAVTADGRLESVLLRNRHE